MHEYFKIKESLGQVLTQAGYREDSESTEVDCYGSICTHYASESGYAKLGWDGIGGYGYASLLGSNGWRDLERKVFEAGEPNFSAAIESLCNQLTQELDT